MSEQTVKGSAVKSLLSVWTQTSTCVCNLSGTHCKGMPGGLDARHRRISAAHGSEYGGGGRKPSNDTREGRFQSGKCCRSDLKHGIIYQHVTKETKQAAEILLTGGLSGQTLASSSVHTIYLQLGSTSVPGQLTFQVSHRTEVTIRDTVFIRSCGSSYSGKFHNKPLRGNTTQIILYHYNQQETQINAQALGAARYRAFSVKPSPSVLFH